MYTIIIPKSTLILNVSYFDANREEERLWTFCASLSLAKKFNPFRNLDTHAWEGPKYHAADGFHTFFLLSDGFPCPFWGDGRPPCFARRVRFRTQVLQESRFKRERVSQPKSRVEIKPFKTDGNTGVCRVLTLFGGVFWDPRLGR